jgi:acetolactate synthase-1/2/3 large subunit
VKWPQTGIAAVPDGVDGTPATVADAVAAAIAAAGTTVAFTFPGGGSNLALLDALHARGVRTVLARGEVGGALMASTAADLTGTPGVLIVGLGPGAASAMNGVSHAWLDRSPLLLVADRYSEADAGTTGHQLLDQEAIYAPVTKAYVDADPADAAAAVERAIAIALEPPRGPVLIEMRRDRARQPASLPAPDAAAGGAETTAVGGDVAAAARALSEARRPLILVGEEARRGVDPSAIVALAERLEAPVLATYKGKGVFPETHRLAAGIFTGAEIERPLLDESDLLVGIGVDPVELLARPWSYEAPVLALRLTDAPDGYLKPRWTLAGDLEQAASGLLESLGEPASEWGPGDAAARLASMLDPLRAAGGPLSAWRAVEVAQEVAGDALVTVDAGAHMFAATWFWRSERPNRFHISNGLATMGFAVPAAIGAAVAEPGETVIAFTGDGGFTINAAELETAARAGAKVIVLVLNDASLSLIRVKQDEIGLERSNVDFVRSDFAQVAEGLGVKGARASTEDELRDALAAAIAGPDTTVIDIAIDGREYAQIHSWIRSGK